MRGLIGLVGLWLLLLAGPAAWAQPSIDSFSPTSGGIGTTVTITGGGFTGVTGVRFGELAARFTINSASQITATVPRVASTQTIFVTTASNGYYRSAAAFTVTRANPTLSYRLVTSNFAGANVGANAAPAVGDIDGDNLLDLLVGRADGTISRYEQTLANGPNFTSLGLLKDASNATISMGSQSTVAIMDINSDGRFCLFLGRGDGTVSEYKQTALNAGTFALVEDNLAGISTPTNTAPCMTDLDGDGNLEMLIGKGDGIISHFEQSGLPSSDGFYRVDSNFNNIQLSGNAATFCTDLDGNGRLDLLVGVADGSIYRYEQSGAGSYSVSQQSSSFNSLSAGSNAKPYVTDIDGDGLLDLLVGRGDGTIDRYEQGVSTNTTPTALSLSPTAINENVADGSPVGSFTTTDAQGGTFTYALVTGTGSTDNASFSISGSTLTINASPDYEAQSSYAIRVRTTDSGGLSFEQAFTITINDVAEVPTVSGFTPTSGPVGTSNVVITGTHFNDAGAVTVRFNGTVATTITVNSNTQLTATVPAGATTGPISVQNADGTGTSTGTFTVTANADLSVTLSDSPDPVSEGATLTYTLGVSNAGPSVASGVTATLTLPASAVFISAAGTGWSCTQSGGVVTATRATLAVGAGAAITVTITVPGQGGTISATASVTTAATDGNAGNNSATATTTVNGVNNAPVVTVPGTQTTVEDTPITFGSANGNAVSIGDVDAGGGAISVQVQAIQGTATLSTTAGLAFMQGTGTADASMTFIGTLANVNAALNGLRFTPNPGFSGAASLQVVANDQGNTGSGGVKSDSETVTINVTGVNDPAVLTASGGSTAFTAGGGAVAVDAGLTATDVDNATLASGTVVISTGLVSAQDVLGFSNTSSTTFGNIVASYTASTGTLTLTSGGATATVAQWQAALRAVTYNNTASTPTGTSRVVSFRVNDGAANSNTVTKAISLTTPTPTITSLTPNSGPVGTSVVIAGANLSNPTAVRFNGVPASSYVVNSSSQITAVVAPGTTTGAATVVTAYGTSNATATFTITAAATSTALASSANPSVFGQSVTFTATVTNTNGSATPTGTVTFRDGATTIGTGALSGGVATYATSTLSVGTHSITATYGVVAGAFNTSTSSPLMQVVNVANTSTTLTSSVNPSVSGQSVTFTATVAATAPGAGTPTGTVTFKDGATTLGTGTLNGSGVATYATSMLTVGTHPITAVYGASTTFATSTSASLSQVVGNAPTTTALTSSLNPSTFGQSVTFTATVAVTAPGTGTPSGTVTFKDGSTTLGTAPFSSGAATFSTSALTQGNHSITAVYGGATSIAGSTSAALTQVVSAPPTPAITTLAPGSGPVGTSVTISGSNLSGATSVSFEGAAQTTITGNTGTSLTVTVPAGATTGDVTVTTPSGESNALTFTVTPPAPVVTSVAGPANGIYRIGQFLTFLVSFDQPVTVSTTGGTPVIVLTVGSTPRGVTYFSGSNTSTLTFRYLVQAGDLDPDGVALGNNSIAPNNGTLRNATGTNAVLTLNNVSALTGVLVDGVAPTAVVSTPGANPTTSSVIPVTITFSKPVTGLTAASIVVTNGTKGTLSGSGTTYTLNVTATAGGAVTIKVNASAAQDGAGNPNPVSNTLTVTYNPPTVSITSFTPTNGTVGTVVVITGNGFTGATAVTINNGAVAGYTVDSNTQITATVAATNTTGLIRVTAPAGTGTSGTNFVVGPAITGITTTGDGTYKAGQTLTFAVAFSQAVTVSTTGGTPTVALTVGSTVRNVPYASGSGTTTLQFRYVVVAGDLDTDGVTLSGSGIDLNGGTIRNSSAVNADLDFDNLPDTSGLLVDAVAPTGVISSPAGSSTATSPIPVTITFSEPVTGLTVADITVTNGTKGSLSGSGTTYTLNVTPAAAGAVTVNVGANAAQDAATNPNVAAPPFSITYAPAPTITSFTPLTGPVGTVVTITGTFFTGTTAVAFNGVVAGSFTVVSATSITATVPVGVTTGRVTVTTPAGTATSTFNFTPATPAVLSVAVPANDTYGVGQALDFSVLYDQVVSVAGLPRLTLTVGSTARNVPYVSGSGSRTLVFRYTVVAGEADFNGVVLGSSITLNGGTIRNAGNSNASLTLSSVAPTTGVLVDGVVPTVALSSPATSPTSTSPIPVTITFSKPVTGLTLAGLTVTNGTAGSLAGSGTTYTVDITPAADGLVTVNLAAASAQDAAGNDNSAAAPFSITYAAPTVVISTLTPGSGPVGTIVTLSGSNFTGATAVTFNGTAATFTVVNGSTITTTVPAGATAGNVVVTAPIGSSNGVLFTVTLPATSTTLVSSVNPAALGQAITFTATVAPSTGSTTPTGTVTFTDGATPLGTGPLNAGGVATFSTSSLGAGSHPITAVYGGSASFAGSASAVLTQVVNGPVTPVITSLTPNSGTVGTSITIAGTNLGGAVSVSFDGAIQTTITANSATSLTVVVPIGATTGDVTVTTNNGLSNALPFTVTPSATSTVLASSVNPAVVGQSITFTATLTSSGGVPSGTVTFTEGATTLGTGPLDASGGATFSTSTLAAGSHSITAVYGGATGFTASTSAVLTQVVNAAPSLPTITGLSAGAELPGMPLTITGTNFTSGSTVSFGGTPAAGVTLHSATSLTAIVPAGAGVGSSVVTVTTAAGSSSSAPAFSVLAVYSGGTPGDCAAAVPATATVPDGAWHYLLSSTGQVVLAYNYTGAPLGDFSADVLRTDPAGPVRQDGSGRYYLDRNFHLTASGGAFQGRAVQLRFYGLTAEWARLQAADAGVSYANLKINQYSGPNEDCQLGNDDFTTGELRALAAPGSTPAPGLDWFVSTTTVTDHFSEFFLTGGGAPLPVQLVGFTATARPGGVALAWRTASETNSARFEVERSADGRAFARIGAVAAQGRTTSPTTYAFLDDQMPGTLSPAASVYYRLRQVDLDGQAHYSPVRVVTLDPAELALYPNPAHSAFTVRGAGPGAALQVFDALGRLVLTGPAGPDGTARLMLPAELPTGLYLVRSDNQTRRLTVE